MAYLFLFGRLRDRGFRRLVFGVELAVRPATKDGMRVVWTENAPVLVPGSGQVEGLLVRTDDSEGGLARADLLAAVHGRRRTPIRVDSLGEPCEAEAFGAAGPIPDDAPPFDLESWQRGRAPLDRAIAREILSLWPERPVEELVRRQGQIAVRAQARLNAETGHAPTTLRRHADPGDVTILARRQPYANFFSVEEADLSHVRFDGTRSEVLNRAAFISGDAVVVLPYDPVRDRVLLTEQFRMGPFARGDTQPWSLEAVAGRIDPGESPESTARREAEEEAGLALGELIPLAGCYPSPGAKAEYLYNFIALCELPDVTPGHGGLPGEGEDIRTHVLPFAQMMALIDSGEINNGPLIMIALLLDRRRPSLRPAP